MRTTTRNNPVAKHSLKWCEWKLHQVDDYALAVKAIAGERVENEKSFKFPLTLVGFEHYSFPPFPPSTPNSGLLYCSHHPLQVPRFDEQKQV